MRGGGVSIADILQTIGKGIQLFVAKNIRFFKNKSISNNNSNVPPLMR